MATDFTLQATISFDTVFDFVFLRAVGKLKIYLNDYILEKSKYITAERMYRLRCTDRGPQENEDNVVRITLNTTYLSKRGREKYLTQSFLGITEAEFQHFLSKNTSQLVVSCRRQGSTGNLVAFTVRSLLAVGEKKTTLHFTFDFQQYC